VADRGEQTLAAVGDAMRFTRERARQVEDKAATRMRALMREKAGK
jgi:DNA-directed RNA polymerase sigma subunit (sigma70/sigma32)